MNVNVITTAQDCRSTDVFHRVAVVIDVFRASTVITTAIEHGAKSVIPMRTPTEVAKADPNLYRHPIVRGGECCSLKIKGFDLGNSPEEYSRTMVAGKDVLLTTSNGTLAITNAADADKIIIACLRNAPAVAEYLLTLEQDFTFVCSGDEGKLDLNDCLCAGLIINMLSKRSFVEVDDLGTMLSRYAMQCGNNIMSLGIESSHVKNLIALGFHNDIIHCFETGKSKVIPVYRNGRIVKL